MTKATEQKTVVTVSGKVTRVNFKDGTVEIFTVPESKSGEMHPQYGSKEFEEMFPIVDIENVSLEDKFMQYEPKNDWEKRVKASIIKAKEIGMKNFRIPAMDPSLAEDEKTIIYCAGKKPAVGKSAMWWEENAPQFMPEKNSRMRDDLEHDVVLGVMQIKYLVEEEGYEVEKAWQAVCVDSKELGHYRNSKHPKGKFESTGSRPVGKCFDLANTCKIVKRRDGLGFMLFGGYYFINSFYCCPLADAVSVYDPINGFNNSVGELVLDV